MNIGKLLPAVLVFTIIGLLLGSGLAIQENMSDTFLASSSARTTEVYTFNATSTINNTWSYVGSAPNCWLSVVNCVDALNASNVMSIDAYAFNFTIVDANGNTPYRDTACDDTNYDSEMLYFSLVVEDDMENKNVNCTMNIIDYNFEPYNALNDTSDALFDFSEWLIIIVVVLAAAIIIGLVTSSFGSKN